jgi:hypothetical protein
MTIWLGHAKILKGPHICWTPKLQK